MKLLLHSCCAPCTLEPYRLLKEAGHSIVLHYANSNIQPKEEYDLRLHTLKAWAENERIEVLEESYDAKLWQASAGKITACANENDAASNRQKRCQACYRFRLAQTAKKAKELGFDAISTTLSVSPWQYTSIIQQELERASCVSGVQSIFQDFTPYYKNATLQSRQLKMYRQNYCGCLISKHEAQTEREQRKKERTAQKAAWRAEHTAELAKAQKELEQKRSEKRAYNEKQAKKHEILRKLRLEQKQNEASK